MIVIKLIILFGLLPFLAVLPCTAESRTVSLGGIFDLTSPAGSSWGIDERDGFLLAIEDFQKMNPEFRINYAIEDSAYSNSRSVSALQKLTNVNGAKFIIGPTWETFVATAPICEKNKIICFAPSNYSNIFHDPKKTLQYSFTAFFDERGYSTILADKLMQDGRKRVAGFSATSAYFETVSAAFLQRFKEKPVFYEHVEPENKDFRSLIVKTPKDIDALLLILDPSGQHYLFLTQWLQLRNDKPIVYTHDGVLYEPNWQKMKQLGFNFQISKPFLEPALERAWTEKLKGKFGRVPGSPSGSIAYDETMITLKCIKSTGQDTQMVRKCIAATNAYPGLSGLLSFGGGQAVTTRVYSIDELSN